MGRNDKTDWLLIRNEYISTDISTRKLADKYGVSPSTLQRRCRLEKWAEQRSKRISRVAAKVIRKTEDRQAASLERIIKLADRVADQIEGMLEEELNDPEILLNTRMHNRELESKVNALCKLYELKREHMGLMPAKDAAKIKLDRERFEHEKQKDDAADDSNKSVRIVIDGDAATWAK